MNTINRDTTRDIQNLALSAIRRAFAADPNLSNLLVSADSGNFSSRSATLKFAFIVPDQPAANPTAEVVSDGRASRGYCLPGEKITTYQGATYTVVRARTKKYLATDSRGKNWLVSFANCK